MFQNNNTIKNFVNLQHTWKISFRVVILSIFSPFGYWIWTKKVNLFTKRRLRLSQLLVIKLLSMGKQVLIIKLLCQTDMFVQLICFKNYFRILWKLPSIFLTVLIFINTGKHRKVLCTNLSTNINECFFELLLDIISARVHGARCTSNAGVWFVIRQ